MVRPLPLWALGTQLRSKALIAKEKISAAVRYAGTGVDLRPAKEEEASDVPNININVNITPDGQIQSIKSDTVIDVDPSELKEVKTDNSETDSKMLKFGPDFSALQEENIEQVKPSNVSDQLKEATVADFDIAIAEAKAMSDELDAQFKASREADDVVVEYVKKDTNNGKKSSKK